MRLGVIGLGRMGAHMVERLMAAGHQLVVSDRNPTAMQPLIAVGAKAPSEDNRFN